MLIAGATLLATAGGSALARDASRHAGAAHADETAMAIPRLDPFAAGGVALPQPLAPDEATRVRQIFALQAQGDMAAAERETRDLADPTLLGPILADRFRRDPKQASVRALSAWLHRHGDEPDAPAVHALLVAALPHGAAVLPAPPLPDLASLDRAAPEEVDPAQTALKRSPVVDRWVAEDIRNDKTTHALALIGRTRFLGADYEAELRAEVARQILLDGETTRALAVARRAVSQSHGRIGLAGLVGGLAAWQLHRSHEAAVLFEAAGRASYAAPSLRAAGAFWAARAHLRAGDVDAYAPWLRRAAAEPRTFYGLLARQRLGTGPEPAAWGDDAGDETLGEADIAAIDALPGGHRAFALLQVGQTARAAAELRLLWARSPGNVALDRALLLVAKQAGLTDLAATFAGLLQGEDGKPRDDLRFPMPRLSPRGGFRIDPAMVYGLARIESNFDPDAVSPNGAQGLMQVMPVAAAAVAEASGQPHHAARLRDPAVNLDIGQRYLVTLASSDLVNGDLIRLLVAYNAGPGNAARWFASIHAQGDPLLFIESIPAQETRDYVRRALTYTWIYAARLGIPARSLDDLAVGVWPRFAPLDARVYKVDLPEAPPARLH